VGEGVGLSLKQCWILALVGQFSSRSDKISLRSICEHPLELTFSFFLLQGADNKLGQFLRQDI
jgi:hypothetical protein